ncbi:hypothetical protein [Ekhidna sp.]
MEEIKDDPMAFYRNEDPRCPHCLESISISDNELWYLYQEECHEIDCPNCGKEFAISSEATWRFTTAKEIDEL